MTCCGHCRDAGDFFNDRTAMRDLKRYLRRGPDASTQILISELKRLDPAGKTLLDIGGGIGAIQLELFEQGLGKSIHVDASEAYQSTAKRVAEERGFQARTKYHFGDFVDLAESLPEADMVTLDKVIYCYPDMERLLNSSLKKTRKIIGLVFPRETFITRTGFFFTNLWFRLRNSDFRTYVHPIEKIDTIIQDHGFREKHRDTTILWRVVCYEKKV
jgi:2-polyprenyl-3-methyl-5-hydroxy-6-metoxy-1,4-benzoquinol methylase